MSPLTLFDVLLREGFEGEKEDERKDEKNKKNKKEDDEKNKKNKKEDDLDSYSSSPFYDESKSVLFDVENAFIALGHREYAARARIAEAESASPLHASKLHAQLRTRIFRPSALKFGSDFAMDEREVAALVREVVAWISREE